MNKVVLIGRLTKDPEVKFTQQSGTAVTQFTLAVNRRIKKETGPTADFIPIVVWGKTAENCGNYLHKGSQASVSGRIETRSYKAQDGTNRYVTEVIAEEVQFLDSKNTGGQTSDPGFNPDEYFGAGDMTPINDGEDMPF